MRKIITGMLIFFIIAAALVFAIPALQVLDDGTVQVEENLNVNGNMNVGGSLNVAGGLTVNGVENASVPKGAIIMWSGTEIPPGWALCDGQNNTPDLRNKFILGTSADEDPGGTGGHHLITLSKDQMPVHNHGGTITGGNHEHTYDDVHWHHHTKWVRNTGDEEAASNYTITDTRQTTGTGAHTHIIPNDGGINGVTQPFDNRPEFFKLAFIIKL